MTTRRHPHRPTRPARCHTCGTPGRTETTIYVCGPCRDRGFNSNALVGGRWVGGLIKRWEPAA